MAAQTQRRNPRQMRGILPGYVRGSEGAARYLGIDRKTFRSWRDDPEIARTELLKPRIIRGEAYYCIERLDRFMDPKNNAPGAAIENHLPGQ